jgi:hypothetical protein
MVQRLTSKGWTVTEVIIHSLYATKVIDIVHELQELGLVKNQDFEFAYHSGEFDGNLAGEQWDRKTVFRFKDPATASWFSLKYSK